MNRESGFCLFDSCGYTYAPKEKVNAFAYMKGIEGANLAPTIQNHVANNIGKKTPPQSFSSRKKSLGSRKSTKQLKHLQSPSNQHLASKPTLPKFTHVTALPKGGDFNELDNRTTKSTPTQINPEPKKSKSNDKERRARSSHNTAVEVIPRDCRMRSPIRPNKITSRDNEEDPAAADRLM
ncbi:hypothetical protein EUGRSUZ_G00578 [Eucalyptus grandis]|uniref:Uncharacterized protein n=2 Tax=Eucalyptus grandis TaxID=71139 RepID=A0ACC3K0G3_EUCGR|nr:hypothetical protein EUGRSUZ_G00578 [Eucalyptus grandis]